MRSIIWGKHYSPKFNGLIISNEVELDEFIHLVNTIDGLRINHRVSSADDPRSTIPRATEKVTQYANSYRSTAQINLQNREVGQLFIEYNTGTLNDQPSSRMMSYSHKLFFLELLRINVFT